MVSGHAHLQASRGHGSSPWYIGLANKVGVVSHGVCSRGRHAKAG